MYVKFLQRKTLKETDILDALTETEFDDLVPLVMSELEAAKVKKANKVKIIRHHYFIKLPSKAKEKKDKKEEEKGENDDDGGEATIEISDKENADQEEEMES